MTVIAVGGHDRIRMLSCANTAHRNGFLAVVDVQKAAGEFVLIGLH